MNMASKKKKKAAKKKAPKAKKPAKAVKGSSKKACTVCRKPGHNARTCGRT